MKHTQAKPIFFVLPRYIPYYYTARTLEDAYGKGVHEGEGWVFPSSPLPLHSYSYWQDMDHMQS